MDFLKVPHPPVDNRALEKPLIISGRVSRISMREEDKDDRRLPDDTDTYISVPSINGESVDGDTTDNRSDNDKETDKTDIRSETVNEFDATTVNQSVSLLTVGEKATYSVDQSTHIKVVNNDVIDHELRNGTNTDTLNQLDKRCIGKERTNSGDKDSNGTHISLNYKDEERSSNNIKNNKSITNGKTQETEPEDNSVISKPNDQQNDIAENKDDDETCSESDEDDRDRSGNSEEENSDHGSNNSGNGNSSCLESEEINCFGDDESGSQTSVEHWTEIEVEKEVMDKIVIQKPGEEPVLNLEVIGKISRGEISSASDLSDKNQEHHAVANDGETIKEGKSDKLLTLTNKSDACKDTMKSENKVMNKDVRKEKSFNSSNNGDTTKNDSDDIDSNIDSAKLGENKGNETTGYEYNTRSDAKENETPNEKPINTGDKEDYSEGDATSRNDSDSDCSYSSEEDNSESEEDSDDDETSDQPPNSDKESVKSNKKMESCRYEHKQASKGNAPTENNPNESGDAPDVKSDINPMKSVKPVNKETDLRHSVDRECDRRSLSSLTSMKSANNAVRKASLKQQKTELSINQITLQSEEPKNRHKMDGQAFRCHGHTDGKHKMSKREHVENLKRVYKQNIALKGKRNDKNNADKTSNSLPNIKSPRQTSPSYSLTKLTIYENQKTNRINSNEPNINISKKDRPKSITSSMSVKSDSSNDAVLLAKRRKSPAHTTINHLNTVKIEYQDLNTKKTGQFSKEEGILTKTSKMDENDHTVKDSGKARVQECENPIKHNDSARKATKDINSLHTALTEICEKDIDKQQSNSVQISQSEEDKRRERAIQEMFALHGSSMDTNDGEIGSNIKRKQTRKREVSKDTSIEPPVHVTQALIVDMPINKIPNQDTSYITNNTFRSKDLNDAPKHSREHSNSSEHVTNMREPVRELKQRQQSDKQPENPVPETKSIANSHHNNQTGNMVNNQTDHVIESEHINTHDATINKTLRQQLDKQPENHVPETNIIANSNYSNQTEKMINCQTDYMIEREHINTHDATINKTLIDKRQRLVYSRTYGNLYRNATSESHVTIPKKSVPSVKHIGQKEEQISGKELVLKETVNADDDPMENVSSIKETSSAEKSMPKTNYVCDLEKGVCTFISTDGGETPVSSNTSHDSNEKKSNTSMDGPVATGIQSANQKGDRNDKQHQTQLVNNTSNSQKNPHETKVNLERTNLIKKDSTLTLVQYILDSVVDAAIENANVLKGPIQRCTSLDDDGNEVLCCILQAPGNTLDPSSFTCDVIDPLDVPPITKRHELLISHVIKFCTYNVGHIAKEREMVAKIPIAHFFVEPWQEVVIREINKSGHWIETGHDVDIVQIPDMGNVLYGVQIALKELTYVAVVTRPRVTTVMLEHGSIILKSPSDPRVKLRVPGTSDPRHVTLQSIPITEKIIKQFENSRGPEITSYITAASPLVILNLEGSNPESFSIAVPFTPVDYASDYIKEMESKRETERVTSESDVLETDSTVRTGKKVRDKEKVDDNATIEPEEVPNVPPRVRKRMESELGYKSPALQEHQQKASAKSKFQELESKVHKKEQERYVVQLGEGHDKSIQIKILDDSDRIKNMDIAEDDKEHVKFSVYDTYARLFAVEFHDIVNFREIQSAVKGLANYLLKHRVRIDIRQDRDNPFSVKFTASVDQPFRQRWLREGQTDQSDSVRYLEMNEGDAIGLAFRGNIEVTNQTQRVFSFHGYRGINASFDLVVKDAFSQKTLPEFHGAVQVYTLKRPRMKALGKNRVQNVTNDWDLLTEYHFMLPKHLKKTPIIINRAPISLRFQEPLTVDFVRQMCRELLKDWDTFAFALGISNARIQAIKQRNRNQISERVLMDVIVCWMKQQPMARDKVGQVLAALRMCRKVHLENELIQRHKAVKETRTKTARDKHIQRAALALCQSRTVTVRWRQLLGYLLHLETGDVKISDVTSEIDEKFKNDATKCFHALQYWKAISGSPSLWKVIDALRHLNCPVAANTLRVQEYKRLY